MSGAEALARRAGLVDPPPQAVVHVEGSAGRAFLHRMLTQDVRSTTVGDARHACLLTARGRVVAHLLVCDVGEAFILGLDAAAAPTAIPALARYVIADDVRLTDVSASWGHLLLVGPGAPAALSAAGLAVPERLRFGPVSIAGEACSLLRDDLGDRPAFRIAVPAARLEAVRSTLAALAGVERADASALDVARVETGTPAWGAEVDDRVLPTEAGLEDAISWTKGCYLGQEAVVMARHRGHPPSLLVRLKVAGDAVPVPGSALLDGARDVGRITTAVRGEARPGVLALAYVRHDAAKAGASLSVAGLSSPATIEAVLAR